MSTRNRLDLQTLGSDQTLMPKNLPDHCFTHETESPRPLDYTSSVSLEETAEPVVRVRYL